MSNGANRRDCLRGYDYEDCHQREDAMRHFVSSVMLSCIFVLVGTASADDPTAHDVLNQMEASFARVQVLAAQGKLDLAWQRGERAVQEQGNVEFYRDGDRFDLFAVMSLREASGAEPFAEDRFQHVSISPAYGVTHNHRHRMGSRPGSSSPPAAERYRESDSKSVRKGVHTALGAAGLLHGFAPGASGESLADVLRSASDITARHEDGFIRLDANGNWGKYTVWVDPANGHLPTRLTLEKRPPNWGETGEPLPDSVKQFSYVVEDIEFETVGDIVVPVACRAEFIYELPDSIFQTSTYRYQLLEVELAPDFEAINAFKIRLPDGTRIADAQVPGVQYEIRNGEIVGYIDHDLINSIDETIENTRRVNDETAGRSGHVEDSGEPTRPTTAGGPQEGAGAIPAWVVVSILLGLLLGAVFFMWVLQQLRRGSASDA